MKKIGLTGGIGSGKSYIAKIFDALAVPVFYADDEAKKILNEVNIIKEVGEALNVDLIDSKTGLADRKKIASIVFTNPNKLKLLNEIIHPKVAQKFDQWCVLNSFHKYVIKEAAILFESGAYKSLDGVICVVTPIDLRIKRVSKRDQQTANEILKRMNNQWTDEERVIRSNWVVYNDEHKPLLSQVLQIHQEIMEA